jgi:hypothetical protein
MTVGQLMVAPLVAFGFWLPSGAPSPPALRQRAAEASTGAFSTATSAVQAQAVVGKVRGIYRAEHLGGPADCLRRMRPNKQLADAGALRLAALAGDQTVVRRHQPAREYVRPSNWRSSSVGRRQYRRRGNATAIAIR